MENYAWTTAIILNAPGIIALFIVAAVITARIFKRICINPLLNEIMDLKEAFEEYKSGKH